MFVISDIQGGNLDLHLQPVNHSQFIRGVYMSCGGLLLDVNKKLVRVAETTVPGFSARATCPATIHERAVTAARAPMCKNGPVAWKEDRRDR